MATLVTPTVVEVIPPLRAQLQELERKLWAAQYALAECEADDEGEDVCCCGESMEHHSSPYDCGHTPVSARSHLVFRQEQACEGLHADIARVCLELELDEMTAAPVLI